MSLVVQKFGGTSLADADKVHRAARRAIRAKLEGESVVLVVSAMADTTDKLLALANAITYDPPKRELDVLLTTGEQVSIALMAMAIDSAGHEAISLTAHQLGLYTDSRHTRARIQRISQDRIERELQRGRIVIVAGFQGTDPEGELTTLGRGASDTTAAALAAVLGARVCEIYTDVDGVYTCDPRLVPQARKISEIGYDEMLEMAALGAGVIQARSIEFGRQFDVPIHIRSSLTDTEGTMVKSNSAGVETVGVRGVTLKENLAVLTLVGVENSKEITSRVFTRLADKQIVVEDIVQSAYGDGGLLNISFAVGVSDLNTAKSIAESLASEIGISEPDVVEDAAKVSVVGAGMVTSLGVAATMFRALADAGVRIEHASTSQTVISCMVSRSEGPRAVQAVHEAFKLDRPREGEEFM